AYDSAAAGAAGGAAAPGFGAKGCKGMYCARIDVISLSPRIRPVPDMPELSLTKLDDLTAISVRGAAALEFLQGQLSQDLAPIEESGAVLAGLHNPQGPCLALLLVLR